MPNDNQQPFSILKQDFERLSIRMEQEVKKQEQKKVMLSDKRTKMRIAICEKEKKLAEKTKNIIYNYAEINRLDIVVDCYSHGESFLRTKVQYNLIFIGYELMDKSGLDVAKTLRLSNCSSFIVFISSNTDFIFESFKVNTYRFLVPPINKDDIYAVLDDFFQKFGNDCPLWIKSGEETYCLSSSDIYYIEADNKHCVVHLQDESLPCNKTMAKVSKVLPKNHFIKINRAYIVNLSHIIKYNSDNVFLKNGMIVHISRNYLKNFKEDYLFFVNPRIP